MTEKKPSEHTHRWSPDPAGDHWDAGFVVFYTPGEYHMDFHVLEIASYEVREGKRDVICFGEGHSTDPDTDEAPLMQGTLKWDGCMNVEIGKQDVVMVHFCGLRSALVLERAMRKLYALGAEHIEKWDE